MSVKPVPDPGERPEGLAPPPHFKTKLRPEGTKRKFLRLLPPPPIHTYIHTYFIYLESYTINSIVFPPLFQGLNYHPPLI